MGRRKKAEEQPDSVVQDGQPADNTPQQATGAVEPGRVVTLGTEMLHPDEIVVDEELNSRDATGNVAELAASILANGQEQNIRVRKIADLYHLVFGYRRHKAASLINEQDIYDADEWPDGFKLRADVVQCTDAQAYAANVRENAQRKDLNLIETARAMDRMVNEFGCTLQVVSAEFGCAKSTVSRNLKLLEAPRPVLKLITAGKTTAEAVLDVLALADEEQVDAGFQALIDDASETGRATKSGVRDKKKKRAEAAGEDEAENKRLTLKQVRLFWEGLRDSELPEGANTTSQTVADWVVRFMDGKYGDRALRSRLAGLTLPK